jgi:nucleotidyltransferase/DNA polymerase involved in DNA repair
MYAGNINELSFVRFQKNPPHEERNLMQKQRDRVVIHFDMDCFYCQVEARRLGFDRSTPLVVDQWGFLLSVNYAAKAIGITRKTHPKDAQNLGAVVAHVNVRNIETGEEHDDVNLPYRDRALYKASLDRYREASEEVMSVMRDVLPPSSNFERASIDECYADFSRSALEEIIPHISVDDVAKLRWENNFYDLSVDGTLARAALLGERIRSEVLSMTGFTVSCGVSETRQVAKLSCALNKPDKLTVVSRFRTTEFMRTVPLKEIRGLGSRTFEDLQARIPWVLGSTLCGELWNENLGNDDFAKWLYDALRGLNDDPVKDTALVANSVQASKQFRPGLPFLQAESMLKLLCSDMLNRLEMRGKSAVPKTLVVHLQCGSMNRSRQEPFPLNYADVERTVISLAYKTGLMSGNNAFDRIAVSAKEVADQDDQSKARKDVADYLSSSRLHFMGTWKTRYLQYMQEVDESDDWGDGTISMESIETLKDNQRPADSNSPKFLLVDMDCFFVSVAITLLGSDKKSPAAVASGLGPTSEICSANYPARKFGIRAGSFVATAREKCPDILIVAVDTNLLTRCEIIWKQVIRILSCIVPSTDRVFGKSCDEALVDITGLYDSSEHISTLVQDTVMKETGVPCSVGIGPSRILAKLATGAAKPQGIKVIQTMNEGIDFLRGQDVRILPGVGYSTLTKLESIGVQTVGDLLRESARVPALIGPGNARKVLNTAQGIDNEEDLNVKDITTVSAEKNFGLRNLTFQESSDLLLALCENVISRLPRTSVVEKAILKLKLAGDDWVEPKKKGGIGDAYDFSKTCPLAQSQEISGRSIHEVLCPILRSSAIDTTRIRGIGVSLKLKEESESKRQKISGQLDKWFAGEKVGGENISPDVEINYQKEVERIVVTDTCLMCGDDIPIGSLTSHFLAAHRNDEVCLCPICKEPIEVTDTEHVASHFNL